jgi:hypothetical protein
MNRPLLPAGKFLLAGDPPLLYRQVGLQDTLPDRFLGKLEMAWTAWE